MLSCSSPVRLVGLVPVIHGELHRSPLSNKNATAAQTFPMGCTSCTHLSKCRGATHVFSLKYYDVNINNKNDVPENEHTFSINQWSQLVLVIPLFRKMTWIRYLLIFNLNSCCFGILDLWLEVFNSESNQEIKYFNITYNLFQNAGGFSIYLFILSIWRMG